MSQPPLLNRSSRPSLLTGLPMETLETRNSSGRNAIAPPRPRRLWQVGDTSLRPLPPFYPPLDPKCSAFISDASPSVLAVRIAECMRKRSISCEYDEEAASATAMTVDRCHFCVRMYRGDMKSGGYGVIVECSRVRGSVITFHRACRAILQAAMGLSSGEDLNPRPFLYSPMEFPRLENTYASRLNTASHNVSSGLALESLEHAVTLLKKDRLGPQQLGMESIVALTDAATCGVDTALFSSLAVLGEPVCRQETCLVELHTIVLNLLRDRQLPGEDLSSGGSVSSVVGMDEHHGGILRALCMRCFCNALTLMSRERRQLLKKVLKDSPFLEPSFLHSLQDDLCGSNRPPGVVASTRLASAHEAALAMRCLRLLGEHTSQDCFADETVLEHLDQARSQGRSTHCVLALEAERTYSQLEDARSC